jgi:START domain
VTADTSRRPCPPSALRWALWLLAASVAVTAYQPAAQAGEWTVLSHRDGLLIERRLRDGSPFFEIRATTESSLAPAAIFETLWKHQEHPEFVPYLKRLDLISEVGDERLTYEQVEVPLARDRDYTVRLQKRVDPEDKRYEILFATANDSGPPPTKDHIRVPSIRGRWLIEPGTDSRGSRVLYEVLNEPGGSLPAWVVNHVQGDAVAKLVRAMLQRTRENASRK